MGSASTGKSPGTNPVRPLILRSWSAAAFRGSGRTTPPKCPLAPPLEKLLDRNADLGGGQKHHVEKLYNPHQHFAQLHFPSPTRRGDRPARALGTIPAATLSRTSRRATSRRKAPRGPMPSDVPRGTYACGDAGFGTLLPLVPRLSSARRPPSGTAGTPSSACSM